MGQFLALGIATRFYISKEKVEKEGLTLEDVLDKMQQNLHFAPDICDFSEEKGYWNWRLKKQIWEAELLDFLKEIYPLAYTDRSYADFEEVLKKLAETPSSSWLELANDKRFESFQFDRYGESERLYFNEKPFRPTVTVGFESVILAMEGKIIMETWGMLFNFFALGFQRAFPTYQLSKAIRMYITG
jgi:hypothetical protein